MSATDHKAARLLKFLIGLTTLSHEHGVRIEGRELLIEDGPGRYMIDPNDTGPGQGIEFKWERG